ncbi:hypothetical protein PIB30_077812 [Stylosanthes scabra]|uniref:Uncharacterized protein n=1 Tax=Stylosanthes scabra TaxID=79078 RepID=A0ABU6QRX7_9FABA|nr:hypothetical protein [Stylosanthes scabra]
MRGKRKGDGAGNGVPSRRRRRNHRRAAKSPSPPSSATAVSSCRRRGEGKPEERENPSLSLPLSSGLPLRRCGLSCSATVEFSCRRCLCFAQPLPWRLLSRFTVNINSRCRRVSSHRRSSPPVLVFLYPELPSFYLAAAKLVLPPP